MKKIATFREFVELMDELHDLCLNAGTKAEMDKFSNQIDDLRDSYPEFNERWNNKLMNDVDHEFENLNK